MKKTILYLTLLTLALMSPARAGAETIEESNLVWTYDGITLTFSKGTGSGNAVIPDIDNGSWDHWRAYALDATGVVIGEGITTIGEFAFYNFTKLKTVTIGKNVETIRESAFCNCWSMETITLPASLTTIWESAFYKCSALKSIKIPDAVTDIGGYAFEGCEKLEEVTIGKNVTNIGAYAFRNCTALKTVYMKPATPPTLGANIFYNCGDMPERIIVPDESVGTYQTAAGENAWKDKIVGEIATFWNEDGTRDGTAEHPYLITSTAGLDLLASKVNSGTEYGADTDPDHPNGYFFELGADITYSYTTDCNKETSTENNYTTIGYYDGDNDYQFKGHFDGRGHTVKGIRIYKGSDGYVDCSQGLFGQIGEGGSVSHVTLDDTRITGYDNVGGIVGYNSDCTIKDCHVTEKVYIHAVKDQAYYHGGIVGMNKKESKGTIVSGCTSRAHITIGSQASNCSFYGGIAGRNWGGTVRDCLYLGGQVGGTKYVGAIAGYNDSGTIQNCYFKTLEDGSGNGNSTITAIGEDYKAIGFTYIAISETNIAYARTVALDDDVALGGVSRTYALSGATVGLTAYAPTADGTGFALALTTTGTGGSTVMYSGKDATVFVKPSGSIGEGLVPTFTVTPKSGTAFTAVSDDTGNHFTMPANDVSVSMTTGYALTYTKADELSSIKFLVDGNEVTSAQEGDAVTIRVMGITGYAATSIEATTGTNAGSVTPKKTALKLREWTMTMPAGAVNVSATMENAWGVGDDVDGSTEAKAYVISTTTGLDLLAADVNENISDYAGKFFKLGGDIAYSYKDKCDKDDSEENNYTAIGYYDGSNDYYFKGHFDGCGHTVSGIRIYKGGYGNVDCDQGLFGRIGESGSVSHVTLDDARITGTWEVAGIVGYNKGGTITDCHVTEKVYIHAVQDNADNHGGIVGTNDNDSNGGIVSGCTSRAHITVVSTTSGCGGIAGNNCQGTIQDCLYLGSEVGGTDGVGAIAGYNYKGTIQNCYYKTLEDGNDNSNSTITAMGDDYPAIGDNIATDLTKNVAYARTITLEGDVAIGGTPNDYAKAGTTPAVHLTTYTPDGGTAPTAMKYTTAGGKAWLFAPSGTELSLGYDGTTGEGYLVDEKATKTDDGSDVTSTVYTGGKLTVPEYDITFSATAEDVWGVSGNDPNNGTEDKPYTITTPGGFKLLAKQVNSGANEYSGTYFALSGDVEFEHKAATDPDAETENNYTAIGYYDGTNDYYFKGHFDGCGHTVKGIRIYKGSTGAVDGYQGLFGQIGEGGSVSHVTLDDARITGYDYVGGIAGTNRGSTITDCHVTENVYIHAVKDLAYYHGGIVGYNYKESNSAIVSGCTSRAHITIVSTASDCHNYGGIAGYNTWGTIQDCLYLGGQVGRNDYVGAIAGYNYVGTIENCYFKTLTDDSGNGNSTITAMGEDYPAIGGGQTDVTGKNVAYARTITLGEGVTLGGTTTDYAKDVVNPSQYLTAYATDGHGFALAHTIVGTETTTALYSVKDATVSVKPSGQLDDGITPTFIVTKSQGGTVEVSSDNSVYTFLMPADDVSVSMLTGVKVTVGARSWATYCIDQAVSLASGQDFAGLYTLSEVGTESVTLSAVSGVASKETPLLIWNGSDTAQDILLNYAAEPTATTEHATEFVGTLAATPVTDINAATVYVLYNNMFVRTTTGSIPANRAYIALGTGSGARSLTIGEATGISLTPDPSRGGEGSIYSIDGRKVQTSDAGSRLPKGIYIQNGRKRVVR